MQSIAEVSFIGGHVALDFVNTAEERGDPEAGDALRVPADLRLWGQRYGLLSSSAVSAEDRVEFRRAIDARELLYALFLLRVRGGEPTRVDLDGLAALIPPAFRAASLEPSTDGHLAWRWSSSQLSSIRHTAVTAAVDLLARTPAVRLKQCPGQHCGWLFIDTTKRGNRRWCSMSECGQDAKTARRRALSKTQQGSARRPASERDHLIGGVSADDAGEARGSTVR
jgi:predicted RNA-binding Zn ribbon-like protein